MNRYRRSTKSWSIATTGFWRASEKMPGSELVSSLGRIGLLMALCVAAPAAAVVADEPAASATTDYLRRAYREDAEKCAFSRADGQALKLRKEPIMRWTNDGDWSGDVFVWTDRGRPEVIGCILSGPGASNL